VVGVLLAFVLLPFVFWGNPLEQRTSTLTDGDVAGALAAAAVVLMLAADIALPIPSSVVMVLSGARFGFVTAMSLSWVGLMLGCIAAYELGVRYGPRVLTRLVGREAAAAVADTTQRFGAFALMMFRAVPVLAEASVILAGASRLPRRAFLPAAAASNLVVAAVYAAAGRRSADGGSLAVAVLVTMALPFAVLFVSRIGNRSARE
jgi:uncharacterized membrane protein YdjX (TVP38/TMEM64 family)